MATAVLTKKMAGKPCSTTATSILGEHSHSGGTSGYSVPGAGRTELQSPSRPVSAVLRVGLTCGHSSSEPWANPIVVQRED